MPAADKRTRKTKRALPVRRHFDAQATFQMYRNEKLAVQSMIDGRRYKVMGDVLRDMMYEFFENHKVDPQSFDDLVVENQ